MDNEFNSPDVLLFLSSLKEEQMKENENESKTYSLIESCEYDNSSGTESITMECEELEIKEEIEKSEKDIKISLILEKIKILNQQIQTYKEKKIEYDGEEFLKTENINFSYEELFGRIYNRLIERNTSVFHEYDFIEKRDVD